MKTTQRPDMFILVLLLMLVPEIIMGYDYPLFWREPTGDMLYGEHFASAWCGKIQDGVDGPSLQTVNGRTTFIESDRCGNYYFCDVTSSQVWLRDTSGIVRVIAGTGEHGFRDGPAGQAAFHFGPSGYNPYYNIKCDDSGRVYVADMVNNRLRMIYRKSDGRWWVTTISGGGTQTPAEGQWISARSLKWGAASAFGILPDGSAAYYAYWGGLYKIRINHQSPELSQASIVLTTFIDPAWPTNKDPFFQWKSGCMMTPDSVFYWSPQDPSAFLRWDEKIDSADVFAGSGTHDPGNDSTGWRQDARWHTHLWTASPSGRAIFSASGDDIMIRRIWDDTVKHLMVDGSYLIRDCGGMRCGYEASVMDVDFKGRLFYLYGVQSLNSNLIERMTFENSDTSNNWEPDNYAGVRKNNGEPAPGISLFVFPNPFNPATLLHYDLKGVRQKSPSGEISIFDCNGAEIRKFLLSESDGDVVWGGTDEQNRLVASGHYLVTLKAGNQRLTQRMVLVR